jgi:phospholipase C
MEAHEGGQADAANLEKVDHVVVVMLENRSFDHMLG